jgi:ABC-2 type transport system permease protein
VGVYLVPALGGDRLALGHSPLGLWLIGSATSLAAISLAMLVAVNVRSILQATAAGGALCLLMGALGGIMVPKMVMPAAMQTMALISPMSWALEGYWDILLRGGDWRSVLPECGVLVTFAALCLTAAALSQHFRHAR